MLYPARKHARRTFEKLLEILPVGERTKPHGILLAGAVTPFRNDTDREERFRQESNFMYLSGCSVPHSFLLAVYQSTEVSESLVCLELFVPKGEAAELMWSLPPPSIEEVRETHDVSGVGHCEGVCDGIRKWVERFPDVLFHTLPRGSALFPGLPEEYTEVVLGDDNKEAGVTDGYLLRALHLARLIKSEEEIYAMKRANEISSRAHEVVMRVLKRGGGGGDEDGRPLLPGEWCITKEAEAEAIFVASCRREGAVHQAYLPIVAGSTRAATLHYCCNDRIFEKKSEGGVEFEPQVLLIDAGCEWDCYASDITRTIPVGNGGKFTKEAAAIYDIVHEMQQHAMSIIKAGVHWDAVHIDCHRTLIGGFQRLGIMNRGIDAEEILKSGVSGAFFPHGVGHSIGLDVHDVPLASRGCVEDEEGLYRYLRLRRRLEEGMVVTVEPGIYFREELIEKVKESEYIEEREMNRYVKVGGIRIEDDIVITKEGYINLTTVKSDREYIELS